MGIFGLSSLFLGGLGATLNFIGSRREANAAAKVAQYQLQADRQTARLNRYFAEFQAKNTIAQLEAVARTQAANARLLDIEAGQQQSKTVDNVRRRRREWQRLRARQRNRVAKSGIQMTGTPLDVLVETAEMAQLDLDETLYSGQARETSLRNRAAELRAARGQTLLQQDYQRATIRAAGANYANQLQAARFAYDVGMDRARATRVAGLAGLFGDAMSLGASGYNLYDEGGFISS